MRLIFTLIFCLSQLPHAFAVIRYVKEGGAGTKDGTSWTNAAADLQEMINLSSVTSIDTIYVAEGKYLPNRPVNALNTPDPANRYNAFTFKKNIRVFGGFPASGTPTLNERNHKTHLTILSGDIGEPGVSADNTYHVVVSLGASITTDFEIDGFTISDGVSSLTSDILVDGYLLHSRQGVGWHNYAASPMMRNLVIRNNSDDNATTAYGIGFYNALGAPQLTNIIFKNNRGNMSFGGAGYSASGAPALANVIMHGNIANTGGGWHQSDGSLIFNNVSIAANAAFYGGGINFNSGTLIFNNSIVAHNTADITPGITNLHNHPIHRNYSLIQGFAGGGNNNLDGTLDPEFENPVAATAAPTAAGDYRLKASSPCINMGSNALVPDGITTDLSGRQRITSDIVDIGAYEYDAALPVTITRFSAAVSGCDAKLTWKVAKEYSMSHYEVETSEDGRNFKMSGQVPSLNEPDRIYRFHPFQREGTRYYRLKAVESDGLFSYSGIVAVSIKCSGLPSVMLYPNPATDQITIQGGSEGQSVEIANANGRILSKQPLSGTTTTMNVKRFPSGIYHAIIFSESGNRVTALKFTLQ